MAYPSQSQGRKKKRELRSQLNTQKNAGLAGSSGVGGGSEGGGGDGVKIVRSRPPIKRMFGEGEEEEQEWEIGEVVVQEEEMSAREKFLTKYMHLNSLEALTRENEGGAGYSREGNCRRIPTVIPPLPCDPEGVIPSHVVRVRGLPVGLRLLAWPVLVQNQQSGGRGGGNKDGGGGGGKSSGGGFEKRGKEEEGETIPHCVEMVVLQYVLTHCRADTFQVC
jgi:hypothetical protein